MYGVSLGLLHTHPLPQSSFSWIACHVRGRASWMPILWVAPAAIDSNQVVSVFSLLELSGKLSRAWHPHHMTRGVLAFSFNNTVRPRLAPCPVPPQFRSVPSFNVLSSKQQNNGCYLSSSLRCCFVAGTGTICSSSGACDSSAALSKVSFSPRECELHCQTGDFSTSSMYCLSFRPGRWSFHTLI
jgi:hypothetical protein